MAQQYGRSCTGGILLLCLSSPFFFQSTLSSSLLWCWGLNLVLKCELLCVAIMLPTPCPDILSRRVKIASRSTEVRLYPHSLSDYIQNTRRNTHLNLFQIICSSVHTKETLVETLIRQSGITLMLVLSLSYLSH